MDISKLSLVELKELERQIPREIRRQATEKKADVRRKLEQLAKEQGFTLAEVVAEGGRARGSVGIKYRHPQQSDLTWSGRGRKPRWVETWLSNGGALAQLEV
ncbi:MAG: H-NS histone family protein [Zoogloeaceae bacterium]|jgi:DNA-binding protein H-NS|nr:H-NS histone family protein [Zoogloeaceae bacterium]